LLIKLILSNKMKSISFPFQDSSLPLDQRVDDLLKQMTLPEKLSQMLHFAQAIPRLGIPAYNWWNEALHGVARNGRATVFPQAINLASTWDLTLVEKVFDAISSEARAKYHAALQSKGESDQYQGLTFWTPNINIFRDPRWGRGQETYGEDPFLTGEMGSAVVHGLQGRDPRHLKSAACAKHFAVHSGPEKDRHHFDARVTPQDLYATYLPAFRKLIVDAGAESVMGAYNRTNGEPCCASRFLLVDILRGAWKFKGHVVSDCWALGDLYKTHKVVADPVEASALALRAGCDLSCGDVYDLLGEAVQQGLITEKDLDQALARTFRARFKLGMFDDAEQVTYSKIPLSVVNSEPHRQLALESARKSMVLLKNQNQALPLSSQIQRLLLVGPHVASVDVLLGNYFGMSTRMTTFMEGVMSCLPEGVKVEYRPGCLATHPNANEMDWSVFEAKRSDYTLAFMGFNHLMEGEEGDAILSEARGDRIELGLPRVQHEYLVRLAKEGVKVVLVISSGSPVVLGELEDLMEAIIWVGYPGQEGGLALAEILFGHINPSGRLPFTFPQKVEDLPPYDDYSMQGRTYRYATLDPLYPFGYGLSYTQFQYTDARVLECGLQKGQPLVIEFSVQNSGKMEGEEVAQIYWKSPRLVPNAPLQQLVGMKRVHLLPGEKMTLQLSIPFSEILTIDEEGRAVQESGTHTLIIGGCSPGNRGLQLGAPTPVSLPFEI
jgi:beta-glucosidase